MLRFLHRKLQGRDYYFPDCPKSRKLLSCFDLLAIMGEERIKILKTVCELEIEESPIHRNKPKKYRKILC